MTLRALACALAFVLAAAAARAEPASVRVTALDRAVRFELSGGQGRMALARGSGVVVSGPAGGPWRVRLERGAAALAMPAGGAGTLLLGRSACLQAAGGVVALQGGEVETVLVLEGTVTSAGSSLPLEAGKPLRIDEAAGLVAVEGPPARELTDVARAARGDAVPGLVDLACAVPPDERAVAIPEGLRLVRLDGGGVLVPPAAGPAPVRVSALREQIAVSLPGEGLNGPGFHLDLAPRREGMSRTRMIAGARGLARFFLAPDWLATLAPGSVVTVEAPDARPEAAELTVQRGAVMLESRARELAAGEPWLADGPRIAPGAGVTGSRTVMVAAGAHAGGDAARAHLERAWQAMRSGTGTARPAGRSTREVKDEHARAATAQASAPVEDGWLDRGGVATSEAAPTAGRAGAVSPYAAIHAGARGGAAGGGSASEQTAAASSAGSAPVTDVVDGWRVGGGTATSETAPAAPVADSAPRGTAPASAGVVDGWRTGDAPGETAPRDGLPDALSRGAHRGGAAPRGTVLAEVDGWLTGGGIDGEQPARTDHGASAEDGWSVTHRSTAPGDRRADTARDADLAAERRDMETGGAKPGDGAEGAALDQGRPAATSGGWRGASPGAGGSGADRDAGPGGPRAGRAASVPAGPVGREPHARGSAEHARLGGLAARRPRDRIVDEENAQVAAPARDGWEARRGDAAPVGSSPRGGDRPGPGRRARPLPLSGPAEGLATRAGMELGVRVIGGDAEDGEAVSGNHGVIDAKDAPCEVVTLFATLPAAPGALARVLPVGVAGTAATELEVAVFASLEGPGRACGAVLEMVQPGGESLPAAVVVPERPAHAAGALAGPLHVLVVPADEDPHNALARAQRTARELAAPGAPGGTDGRLVALGLLALAWWVRRTRTRWARALRASVDADARCPRCALPLEIDAIGELPVNCDAAAVLGLVRGMDAIGVVRAVAPLRDAMRAVEDSDLELRYRLTGSWCVRCEDGSLAVQLRRGDDGLDEAVFAFAGAATQDAVRQLAGRPARSGT